MIVKHGTTLSVCQQSDIHYLSCARGPSKHLGAKKREWCPLLRVHLGTEFGHFLGMIAYSRLSITHVPITCIKPRYAWLHSKML